MVLFVSSLHSELTKSGSQVILLLWPHNEPPEKKKEFLKYDTRRCSNPNTRHDRNKSISAGRAAEMDRMFFFLFIQSKAML